MTVEQLSEAIQRTGLMTRSELEAFVGSLPRDQRTDPESVARELVRQHKLTPFQALLLVQGQANSIVFGEYTVLEKIGEGGMGIVCKAQHRRLKRLAAVKVLHPAVTKSEDAVRRFRREAEAMTRLSHPNIVAAYDANEQDGSLYVVMELVQGTDLNRLVREKGPLPVRSAVEYILQAARGLEHAHRKGVVHRDIKPSNLLLDEDGTIKILDMGLVRFLDGAAPEGNTEAEGLTRTGDIMGSFDYMAPEQAVDTKRADQRADIYSLGCTFYFLLTGQTMYAGETSMQKLLAHRDNAISSLRRLRDDVPLALDAVFHRMVAKKPEDRYPSMTELIRDLETSLEPPTLVASEDELLLPGAVRFVSTGNLLIVCGTLCILTALVVNVLTVRAVNASPAAPMAGLSALLDEALLVKWFAYAQGTGMIALGTWLSLLGVRLGGLGRLIRWLLGAAGGMLAGGLIGLLVGWWLATSPAELVKTVGCAVVGGLAAAAFFGRRAWLTIPVLALAGYFAGIWVGRVGIDLGQHGLAVELGPVPTAVVLFGLLGGGIGAALAVRFSSQRLGRKKRRATDADRPGPRRSPPVAAGHDARTAHRAAGNA
jgi:serine/threonine protein kinase